LRCGFIITQLKINKKQRIAHILCTTPKIHHSAAKFEGIASSFEANRHPKQRAQQ